MNPILFPSSTTFPIFNEYGELADPCIAPLADTISCKITEDISGVFDIELQYPSYGPFASNIVVGNIIGARYPYRIVNYNLLPTRPEWGDISAYTEFFDIYKIEITDNVMRVYGHQISYRLNYSIVNGTSGYQSPATVQVACASLSGDTDPDIGTSVGGLGFVFRYSRYLSDVSSKHWESVNTKTARSFLVDDWYSIKKVYGVSVSFHEDQIYVATRRGKDDGVEVRIGKNMVKRQWSTDTDGTFNAIAPYWVKDTTKVVANPLIITPTTARTPIKPVPMDFTDQFQTQPSAADLATAARAYLDENQPWTAYETTHIEIAPRWDTGGGSYSDKIVLGDTLTVFWRRTNVLMTKMDVCRVVYDVLSEEYETLELGDLQTGYVVTANV